MWRYSLYYYSKEKGKNKKLIFRIIPEREHIHRTLYRYSVRLSLDIRSFLIYDSDVSFFLCNTVK